MTAPVFLADADTLEPCDALACARAGDAVVLTGAEARHAVVVRRVRPGERVDVVDGHGLRLVCEVTEAGQAGRRERLGLGVREVIREPACPLRLTLVQALAKAGRDEQAVETATEVGAELVIPWQAERCVSVWKAAKAGKGRQRWQATAREAAKQARRATVPVVAEAVSTADLASWVEEVTVDGGVVLVLHEEARAPIGSIRLPELTADQAGQAQGDARRVLGVVVGPEGGISPAETARLEAAGAVTVRLGPHVMRTASAGPVALALLAQRAGLWG